MQNNDGTPAIVDLDGAIDAMALMYGLGLGKLPENDFWDKRQLVEDYVAKAIAAEREACAKIAETRLKTVPMSLDAGSGAHMIAAAIRARNTSQG